MKERRLMRKNVMEGRKTTKMMKMRSLNEDRTHMEDPEDKEDNENERESLE